MDRNRNCKGCADHYRVSEEQISRILASAVMESGSCVDDAEYAKRLRSCGECPKLLGGTTCALCGCIVRISAKFAEKRCPYPGGSRWRGDKPLDTTDT